MYEEENKVYRERQMLRYKLLKDIYEIYFSTNGNGKKVTQDQLKAEENLAYKYLSDLGFIEFEQIIDMEGSDRKYTITAHGINFVEEGKGRRKGDFKKP